MPEYIRSLIVILGLSFPVFYFAKVSMVGVFMPWDDFKRRRNLWVGLTLAAFLCQNYWIFLIVVIWLTHWTAKKESNRIALFFFVCIALPQITVEIPGLGGVRYFLAIDYLRIITFVLLFPICLEERRKAIKKGSRAYIPDIFLASYLMYLLLLDVQYSPITNSIRLALGFLLDIVIPYYAISRHIKTETQFKGVLASFLIAALLAAAIGVFEFFRRWLLYYPAGDALGVLWEPGYLPRGDYVRAMGTSGQPIVFGYVLTIAIVLYSSFLTEFPKKNHYLAGLFLLLAGVISPLSKGPWVGLFCAGLFLLATSQSVLKNTLRSALIFVPAVLLMLFTEGGQTAMSFLPFVGNLDESSFAYREQLFNKSINIVYDNFLFGSIDYLDQLEEMRTGLGIIDLVNTFLLIALNSGIIGLSLFLCFFLSIGYVLYKTRAIPTKESVNGYTPIARSLVGANIAILVTIATVSPIYHVPFFMWVIPALSLAYSRIQQSNR